MNYNFVQILCTHQETLVEFYQTDWGTESVHSGFFFRSPSHLLSTGCVGELLEFFCVFVVVCIDLNFYFLDILVQWIQSLFVNFLLKCHHQIISLSSMDIFEIDCMRPNL
jgi:hypothetical protein